MGWNSKGLKLSVTHMFMMTDSDSAYIWTINKNGQYTNATQSKYWQVPLNFGVQDIREKTRGGDMYQVEAYLRHQGIVYHAVAG